MNQQLAIIVMVDVDSAIIEMTLNNNVYIFDNIKPQASEGRDTNKLVSTINGTHWIDGSQANERIINWLPYSIGSILPTIPSSFNSNLREKLPEACSYTPVIRNITGEAVDKKIIFPAMYGSPNLVTDGWYWSASVDSGKPGMYSYIIHLQLSYLTISNQTPRWKQVDMQCEAWLKVSTSPKVNGFTGAGMGLLPVI
jgi:hypothetical protein